jgi:hypothetical protein
MLGIPMFWVRVEFLMKLGVPIEGRFGKEGNDEADGRDRLNPQGREVGQVSVPSADPSERPPSVALNPLRDDPWDASLGPELDIVVMVLPLFPTS